MIISVTHELLKNESILRVYPPQIFNADNLIDKVLNIESYSGELQEKERDLDFERERCNDLQDSLDEKRESIKDAVLILDELLVEKPNKPEMMKIIETLRNDLRKAHE